MINTVCQSVSEHLRWMERSEITENCTSARILPCMYRNIGEKTVFILIRDKLFDAAGDNPYNVTETAGRLNDLCKYYRPGKRK